MGRSQAPLISSEAERARGIVSVGILAFRWAALGWMAALAATSPGFRRPELAWVGIGAAGAWTAWLAVPRRERPKGFLWFDLALAAALVVSSGVVVPEETVGLRPFYATAYPAAAVLCWAVAGGVGAGLSAALIIGAGIALSRPINGLAFGELTSSQWQSLANGAMTYLLTGGAVGLVSRLLDRSAAQFRAAVEETIRARERAARLAERESLARQIHDSVLQALALVHKRGRELGRAGTVPGEEVLRLAEVAGGQEDALRSLVMREVADAPTGSASLRDGLEALVRQIEFPISVAAVGPAFLPRHAVEEVTAAVRQALENVVEHARATRASVFVDQVAGEVVVSVGDDGDGFDPEAVGGRSFGLKSMRGRIEDLGGRFLVASRRGHGTEIEMRIPVEASE